MQVEMVKQCASAACSHNLKNIQHSTFNANIQEPGQNLPSLGSYGKASRRSENWTFDVEC